MSTATVTLTWANDQPTNSDLTPGTLVASIKGGTLASPLVITVPVGSTTVDIPGVPVEASTDPDYIASVQMVDDSSPAVAIGVAIPSDPFSILQPPVVVMTPGKVSVSIGPVVA